MHRQSKASHHVQIFYDRTGLTIVIYTSWMTKEKWLTPTSVISFSLLFYYLNDL